MSKYIIIPIIFTSTIVYGDNQKFNEYAIFCEKMIVTLQSCTDEKSTFSHSSEFPIILYTVLNENPLKDFFKKYFIVVRTLNMSSIFLTNGRKPKREGYMYIYG